MSVPEGAVGGSGERSAGGEGRSVPGENAWGLVGETSTEFGRRDPEAIDDATELYLLDRHTASDGTVTVQLLGWERDDDVVRVEYALPTGARRTDRYRWPTAGRYDESDFLAMVCELGYTAASADLVGGELARARNENGHWRIVTGREPTGAASDRTDRGRGANGARDGDTAGTDGVTDATPTAEIPRRLRAANPMRTGFGAVLLSVLAVLLPATLAVGVGGITTWIAGVGAALFAASIAALALSVAAVS